MAGWIGLCALAAALELFCGEERAAAGLECVCGLAVALAFTQWASEWLRLG